MEDIFLRSSSTLKRLTPLLTGLLSLAAVLPAAAEQQMYTRPQAVEYALRNNGELSALREEKGIKDAGRVKAGLLPNPTLELDAGTGALSGSSDESTFSLGVSQEFLLSGKREKRLAIAESELEIYRWQLADRERQLREAVKTAFYDAILAEQRTLLADRLIALNRQLFDVAKERLAAGDIPELEMNLVKVELARSEGSRIDGAKALYQSQAKLWNLMGVSDEASPTLTGSLDSELNMVKSLVELKQLARGNRPDLKVLDAEKIKGEADIILAQVEAVPNLTAGLFYSHERRTDATGIGEETVRDNLLGIRLSLPLPLFDRNQAGVQEARARRSSTESRLLAAIWNVEREVNTAYASYLNSEKVLSLYKTNIIPQLEENLKLTQEAYRLGEIGILAVIQEQKKFFEVSDGYLLALHDRQTAFVKLETAVATELSGGVQ
jgi:cobalt-zinc-cadmium efflux system outer membrane protein